MAKETRNFFDHLHAPTITLRALHPLTTLGLGIAALTCLGVLLTTGLTLFLYYVPEQEEAYERILHITTTLRFGSLVRNLHFLAANALLILAVLHLGRVFLTGSYRNRRLNWVYGLFLLLLILTANFTGYLLPWDQISYWAVKVGSSLVGYYPIIGPVLQTFLLGGEAIGPETLSRAFALHAGAIPLSMLVLCALHLWRIRKDGGLAASFADPGEKVPAAPWLLRAEGAVALLTLASLLALSLFIDAPIYERADPLHPPNPARAPWYFVGVQEMVSHSAFFGGVVAPTLIALFLLMAPLLDRGRSPGGRWFIPERRWLNLIFIVVLLGQIGSIIVGQWFRTNNWQLHIPFF
jgi:quinol-cytochrome oxidoreductase complex cytochrome b subunit